MMGELFKQFIIHIDSVYKREKEKEEEADEEVNAPVNKEGEMDKQGESKSVDESAKEMKEEKETTASLTPANDQVQERSFSFTRFALLKTRVSN